MSSYLSLYVSLKKSLKNSLVHYNYSLKAHSTFKIGGKAKLFIDIGSLEDIIVLLSVLEKKKVPYFVLGNGSNTLISSNGFCGVVIYFAKRFSNIVVKDNLMLCDAGAMVCAAYNKALSLGLSGLEGTAGLPASVGGMVYMNASCFGFETAAIVDSVLALVQGKIRLYTSTECKFGYRDSIFQHIDGVIILKVQFKLKSTQALNIAAKYRETLNHRLDIQPKGYSCGCVFRRMPNVQVSKMLDDLGIKGKSVGDAIVSQKHANFILNKGNATSKDVVSLIHDIEGAFEDKYHKSLSLEIKYLGDKNEIIR
jgi:UDP-N-acetylmuramate dehydrogenase